MHVHAFLSDKFIQQNFYKQNEKNLKCNLSGEREASFCPTNQLKNEKKKKGERKQSFYANPKGVEMERYPYYSIFYILTQEKVTFYYYELYYNS